MWFNKKITVGKLTLEIPKDMLWCFDRGEYYEKNVTQWFEKIVRKLYRPVIYDVGANYGFFSVAFSPLATRVYAFEPVKKTHAVLEKNLQRNKMTNVVALRYGLSNKEGICTINMYSSSGNNSIFKRTIPEGHPLKFTGEETIHLIALDDYFAKEKLLPPHIMKLDVEGAELLALQGARKVLSQYKPVIFMEFSENTSRDAGYSREELVRELNLHGYQFWGLSEQTSNTMLYPPDEFSKTPIANIIAVPAGFQLA